MVALLNSEFVIVTEIAFGNVIGLIMTEIGVELVGLLAPTVVVVGK